MRLRLIARARRPIAVAGTGESLKAHGVMRQNGNHKRPRNRGNLGGRKPSNNRNQTFDSNGPSVRIRGNAFQVHEKYLTLARDAYTSGDRVMAENYFQHAEHYYRVVNATTDPSSQNRMNGHGNLQQGGYGADDGDYDEEFEPQHHRPPRTAPRRGGESAPDQDGAEAAPGGDRGDARQVDRGDERNRDRGEERHGDRGDERGDRNDRSGERRRRSRNFNGRDDDRRPRMDGAPQLALDGAEQAAPAAPADAAAPSADAPSSDPAPRAESAAPDTAEKPRRRRRRPPAAAAEDTTESSARDGDEADTAAA